MEREGFKMDRAILISDIHLFNADRYDEQDYMMKSLLNGVNEEVTDKTMIIIGGDVFHNKGTATQDSLLTWNDFIGKLEELGVPVIVISGNHDLSTVHDKSKLDLLGATFVGRKWENVKYIGETGMYKVGDVGISVLAIRDIFRNKSSSRNEVVLPQIPSNYPEDVKHKIMVMHATVYEGSAESYDPEKSRIPLGLIPKEVECLFLGDLHEPQTYKGKIRSRADFVTKFSEDGLTYAYPGSTRQNTFVEDPLYHGFQVWDFEKREIRQVPIEQHTLRLTGSVMNNVWVINGLTLEEFMGELEYEPKKIMMRVFGDYEEQDVKELKKKLKLDMSIITMPRLKSNGVSEVDTERDRKLCDIACMNNKETLIEYLKTFADYKEEESMIITEMRRLKVECPEGIKRMNEKMEDLCNERNKKIEKMLLEMDNVSALEVPNGELEIVRVWSHGISCFTDFNLEFGRFNQKVSALLGENGDGKSKAVMITLYSIFGGIPGYPKGSKKGLGKGSIYMMLKNDYDYAKEGYPYTGCLIRLNGKEYIIQRSWLLKKDDDLELNAKYTFVREVGGEDIMKGSQVDDWVAKHIGNVETFASISFITQDEACNLLDQSLSEQTNTMNNLLKLKNYTKMSEVLNESKNAYEQILRSAKVIMPDVKDDDDMMYEAKEMELESINEELRKIQEQCGKYSKEWLNVESTDLIVCKEEMKKSKDELEKLERPYESLEDLYEKKGEYKGYIENEEDMLELERLLRDAEEKKEDSMMKWKVASIEMSKWISSIEAIRLDDTIPMEDLENEEAYNLYNDASSKVLKTRDELITQKVRIETKLELFGEEEVVCDLKEIGLEPERPKSHYRWDGNSEKNMDVTEMMIEDLEKRLCIMKEEEMSMGLVSRPSKKKEDVDEWFKRFKELSKDAEEREDVYEDMDAIAEYDEEMNERKKELEMYKSELKKIEECLKESPYNDECNACRQQPLRIQMRKMSEKMEEVENELKKLETMRRKRWTRVTKKLMTEIGYDDLKIWIEKYTEMCDEYDEMILLKKEHTRYRKWLKLSDEIMRLGKEVEEKRNEYERTVFLVWTEWDKNRRLKEAKRLREEYEDVVEELRNAEEERRWKRVIEYQPMYKKRKELTKKKSVLEKEEEGWRKRMENAKEEIEKYEGMIKYKRYEDVIRKIKEIERYEEVKRMVMYWSRVEDLKGMKKEYDGLKLKERELESRRIELMKDVGGMEYEKRRSEKERENKRELMGWCKDVNVMCEVVKGLSRKMNGYREWLMGDKVGPTIVSYANEIMRKLHGNDEWRLGFELMKKEGNGTIDWYMYNNGKRVHFKGAGGFQQFLMNISVRIALSQMIGGVRSKQLIIDEGFTSADTKHLSRVPDFLRGLIGMYDSVIIVSHLEKLKDGVDQYIMVRRDGNESYLEVDEWGSKNVIMRIREEVEVKPSSRGRGRKKME
jgi:DNA repair exonuclease SbcCD ATPase subunit/DNA repair exonuclease SbcCD nuclease subunit